MYAIKTLYCSLVRSILEYAAPVWTPFYATQILAIERVQRKFIRFALRQLPWNDPVNLPSYPDRCRLINLKVCHRGELKCSVCSCLMSSQEVLTVLHFLSRYRSTFLHVASEVHLYWQFRTTGRTMGITIHLIRVSGLLMKLTTNSILTCPKLYFHIGLGIKSRK